MKATWGATVVTLVFSALACAQDRTIDFTGSSYAAIAYSPATGKFGYSYNLRSRAAADKVALEKCAAEDARIVTWVSKGFVALALGTDKSCWGVGWSYGNGSSNTAAKENALNDCQKRTSGAHVALALSSDGQYIWDALDHTIVLDKEDNIRDGRGNLITPTPAPGASPATDWRGMPLDPK